MRKRIASARGDLTGDGAAETLILSGEQSAVWRSTFYVTKERIRERAG